jgi:hypothetical protein
LERSAYLEEVSWRQKSRALWLREGDNNTKFFHRLANSNRRHNSIESLVVEGNTIVEADEIKNHIVEYYKNLYSEQYLWRPTVDDLSFLSIDDEEQSWMEREFEEGEVWEVVRNFKGDKAPGPDGFSLAFFQHCWEVLKVDIMAVFQEFHERGKFEKSFNATFVSLIPKKAGAVEMKDFRPISLVGGVYKIISKVLANRLKTVLGKIVSNSQHAFIKGRQILDAVLVANECLDSRLRSGEPGLLCKLDLEKAYDHVNWAFVLYLLQRCGFGARWCGWIQHCISTVRFSILINGSPSGFFGSSRGIRQGDPLSPLLFVVVMEALSRMLSSSVERGLLSGFSVGSRNNEALIISHLLFADDTLILCEPNVTHFRDLRCLFLCFEAVSGLKINLSKSEIVPIGEVENVVELASILGCGVATLPMKYLGLPLGAHYKASAIWSGIIEKMESRLAGWKRMYLSKGGRLTLIKSTLSNLPTYYLSLFPIPVVVANRLEKLQRDFLWGGLGDEFKFHLVNWSQICTPKMTGGLGVRRMVPFNRALLGKWLWRFATERDALWRKVVDVKYDSLSGGWCSKEVGGPYGVGVWKCIRRGWAGFANHVRFEVGDGSKVLFWHDVWCGEQPLKNIFPELFTIACRKDVWVAETMQIHNGSIHWHVLFTRPVQDWEVELVSRFFEMLYSQRVRIGGEDQMCWIPSKRKFFEVKSYYQVLSHPTSTVQATFPWKGIWKVKAPPRVAFFVWTAILGKILTLDNLRKRNIIVLEWCCLCRKGGESIDHLFIHCEVASEMWTVCLQLFGVIWVMPRRVSELMECWRGQLGNREVLQLWRLVPLCLMWCLWRERNARSFEDREIGLAELKRLFLQTLYNWRVAWNTTHVSTFSEFLNFCSSFPLR